MLQACHIAVSLLVTRYQGLACCLTHTVIHQCAAVQDKYLPLLRDDARLNAVFAHTTRCQPQRLLLYRSFAECLLPVLLLGLSDEQAALQQQCLGLVQGVGASFSHLQPLTLSQVGSPDHACMLPACSLPVAVTLQHLLSSNLGFVACPSIGCSSVVGLLSHPPIQA